MHFGSYSWCKNTLSDKNSFLPFTLQEGPLVHLLAASIAVGSTVTVSAPLWLIKTRMQLQTAHNQHYTSSWDCARKVWTQEGIRGFYKGLVASYVGISESAVQFVLYEQFKVSLQYFKLANASSQSTEKQSFLSQGWNLLRLDRKSEFPAEQVRAVTLSPVEYLSIASLAKLIASAATYPHEVVRTRVRETSNIGPNPKYKGFMTTLRIIAREEGMAGLYGGLGPHLVRVVPNAAILFFVYESVLKFMQRSETR